jgi:hypothetical protein
MDFTHFGAFLLAPFIAISAWFGFGHHVATTTPPTSIIASTTITTNGSLLVPGSNGVLLPHQPLRPFHPMPVASSTPTITALSPASGAIGSEVTIMGTGFVPGSIVRFGPGTVNAVAVSSDGTSLTFTVPISVGPHCASHMMCPMYVALIVEPGVYSVSVENPAGTEGDVQASNALSFSVTGPSTIPSSQIIINGIDAPASLSIGTAGTWTVQASSPNTFTGNLHYSVVWGDEGTPLLEMRVPDATSVSSSATFTHTYEQAGTYTPTFTVTDDAGHSATASATVVVNPVQ